MFKFKNISSDEMAVVVEEETDILGKAQQRTMVTEVLGYDGAKEVPVGYDRISKSITLILMQPDKLDDVLHWLNGQGILEYKGRKTIASFYNSVQPVRFSSKIKINCKFIRNPFWYKDSNFTSATTTVTNEGNVNSRPIIQLQKGTSSSCELTIAGIRFKYNFESDASVEIDCKEKTASFNGLRRNRQLEIGFEFPVLKPGSNSIMIHSGNPTVLFKYKDVFL